MARGKVITTHLRTGDPNGIRTVFISNKICEMIVFPKSEFEMVSKMEESSRPALYILLGEDENGSAQAYIGESTNGVKRVTAAVEKAPFSSFSCAFTNLTAADVILPITVEMQKNFPQNITVYLHMFRRAISL